MLLVLVFDGAGYLLAVTSLPDQSSALVSVLEDIFVAVAILSISVGLVLPGIIAHAMVQVSDAATAMAKGAMANFSNALLALGTRRPRRRARARRRRAGDGAVGRRSRRDGDEHQSAAGGNRARRGEPRSGARGTARGAPRRADRTHHAPGVRAPTRCRAGKSARATHRRTRCCIWISITSRSSTTPAATPRATNCCGRSPACCAPSIRNRDSVARLGRRRVRDAAGELPAAAGGAHRAGSCCKAIQAFSFASGEKIFKIGAQHRPGHVLRRQRRIARADARGRRRLLRREEEGPQSHPRLSAGGP